MCSVYPISNCSVIVSHLFGQINALDMMNTVFNGFRTPIQWFDMLGTYNDRKPWRVYNNMWKGTMGLGPGFAPGLVQKMFLPPPKKGQKGKEQEWTPIKLKKWLPDGRTRSRSQGSQHHEHYHETFIHMYTYMLILQSTPHAHVPAP